jgi:hypothetical protein
MIDKLLHRQTVGATAITWCQTMTIVTTVIHFYLAISESENPIFQNFSHLFWCVAITFL